MNVVACVPWWAESSDTWLHLHFGMWHLVVFLSAPRWNSRRTDVFLFYKLCASFVGWAGRGEPARVGRAGRGSIPWQNLHCLNADCCTCIVSLAGARLAPENDQPMCQDNFNLLKQSTTFIPSLQDITNMLYA